MLKTSPTNDNVQMIVDALSKKSKSTLAHRKKALKRQALYFSPTYRDFICKIISNSSLKIVDSYEDGYLIAIDTGLETESKLSKRRKNKIVTDIDCVDTLPHELGHAVDFLFGRSKSLSKTVVISDNKTLYDIFTEEFESKHEELYEIVMKEYKEVINATLKENAYDILFDNMPKYRELCAIEVDLQDKAATAKRRAIQQELYKSNFVETYYQLYQKNCYSVLNDKYGPILDALSSKYNFEGLRLCHHKESYYKYDEYNPVYEFFANLFRAEVTSRHVYIDNLLKYLPKSFDAFEKLFAIAYSHIQNNKRFTDVELKKVR